MREIPEQGCCRQRECMQVETQTTSKRRLSSVSVHQEGDSSAAFSFDLPPGGTYTNLGFSIDAFRNHAAGYLYNLDGSVVDLVALASTQVPNGSVFTVYALPQDADDTTNKLPLQFSTLPEYKLVMFGMKSKRCIVM